MSADIVIAELMDEAAVAELAAEFRVFYDPHLHASPHLAETAAPARALIVRHETQVGRALLEACTRLEVIGRLGVALDNIALDECARRNIAVIPATGANAIAVAEYVICTLLMLLRGSFLSTGAVARGEWPRPALIGREMHGKTLGLVGFGAVARTVAARASAMGMRVLAHDPLIPLDSVVWREYPAVSARLEELLAGCDAVSLHVPLTPQTRGLLHEGRITAMKRGAVLVNTVHGGVVDERAVAAALREGRLGGAALDAFLQEPLPPGNPFEGVPNLVLTPHIAGVTVESNERASALIAENVRRALRGGA